MNTQTLLSSLIAVFPNARATLALNEVTLVVDAKDYLATAQVLRDHADFQFSQLIDLCGLDCIDYQIDPERTERFAVVTLLLSGRLNQRLRLRVYAQDSGNAELPFPEVDSLTDIWNAAGWYEREAFDLFGIVFTGHDDLRRILTDYGFVGHPLRKDFPVSGYLEVRFDDTQKRVVYQPVSIPPRELTPRIIREPGFAHTRI